MTYENLLKKLQNNRADYYEQLLIHSSVILDEIGRKNKRTVALELHIEPTLFSTVYKLILAHDNLK